MAPQNPGHRVVAEARSRGCREGAVLLLLYPRNDVPYVVLTERTAHLRSHAGQISLPGGRIDAGESAVEAALREAWEELRVPAAALTVLGRLSELYIPPSNYCLQPIVAVAEARPDFHPQPNEVALVIETPLEVLLDPANHHEELRFLAGEERRIPYFWFDPHKIWGATAMILNEFLAVWEGCEFER
ncbi:MAG: CoA pyrophosphatase [Ardenticatenales bacterium]|nr:CoA pyrophosphatase [Ardenticatenales bacterium]MCB9171463.1 CoA pyrophosphatase [Ardenticatenales bacterium]